MEHPNSHSTISSPAIILVSHTQYLQTTTPPCQKSNQGRQPPEVEAPLEEVVAALVAEADEADPGRSMGASQNQP